MSTTNHAVPVAVLAAGAAILYWARRRRKSEWMPTCSYASQRAALLADTRIDQLLVITDFDATLTTGDSEQCHDLIGFSKIMSQPFREAFAPLLDWQTNAATDGVQWWDVAHGLMVEHGQPPRSLIPRLVRDARIKPRPGALKMLRRLAALNIPVLIVSAGVSDIIEEFLRQHGVATENITICSNRLNYAADMVPQSVAPTPPITSFTKSTAYAASAAFFKKHAACSSVLVLGDSTSDIDSAENVPYRNLLSIGFLNGKEVAEAPNHSAVYDALVLGNEGNLDMIDALVDDIASAKYNECLPEVRRMRRLISDPNVRRTL